MSAKVGWFVRVEMKMMVEKRIRMTEQTGKKNERTE